MDSLFFGFVGCVADFCLKNISINKVLRKCCLSYTPLFTMKVSEYANKLIRASGERQRIEDRALLEYAKVRFFDRAKSMGLRPAVKVRVKHSGLSLWQRILHGIEVLVGKDTEFVLFLNSKSIAVCDERRSE